MTLTQQRRLDTLAAGLLLGGAIIGTVANYFTKLGFWHPGLSRTAVVLLLLVQPLFLGQAYAISKGKRWAKILYLVLTGIGLLGFALDRSRLTAIHFTSPGATINYLSQNGLALAVTVLLACTLGQPTPEPVEPEEEEEY